MINEHFDDVLLADFEVEEVKMPQCGIEVTSNDPALLSYLVKHPEKSSWFVTENKGVYYLIAPNFQGLTTPEEVQQAANDLIFILNGIMKLNFKHAHLIRGTTVAYFDNSGQLTSAVVSKSVAARFHLSGGELFFQDADVKRPSSMNIWMKAQNNALVEEALQHFANEHNWFNLYKVYEIIKKDTCRAEETGTIDKDTFTDWTKGRQLDFKESANKGRHSSLGYHPSKGRMITYMSLQEADEYVTDLFFLWLQSK